MGSISRFRHLIDMTPIAGALRDQFEMELTGFGIIPGLQEDPKLELLRKQLEVIRERFEKRSDSLNDMAQRNGQDSPEFDCYFAEWLHLKAEYESVFDEMTILEARMHLAAWLATLPSPKKREGVMPQNKRKQS